MIQADPTKKPRTVEDAQDGFQTGFGQNLGKRNEVCHEPFVFCTGFAWIPRNSTKLSENLLNLCSRFKFQVPFFGVACA